MKITRKTWSVFICCMLLFMCIPAGLAEEIPAETPAASSNADLKSLSVMTDNELDLDFQATITDYQVSVSEAVYSVEILAYTDDINAKLKINGEGVPSGERQTVDNLAAGTNEITLEVTAEDLTTVKTYTITVIRAEEAPAETPVASNNADLESIGVSSGTLTPKFAADTLQYAVDVTYETTSIEITAEAADSKATVKIIGPADSLLVGANEIAAEVTAEDGTTKTYTLTVTRAEAEPVFRLLSEGLLSSIADLGSLEVLGDYTLDQAVNAETIAYTVTVPHEVESVDITAAAADENAFLAIGDCLATHSISYTVNGLLTGDNLVTITITAPDGNTTKNYTLTITRAAEVRPDQLILSWTGNPQTTQTLSWRALSSVSSGQVQYMKESEQTPDFSGAQAADAVCTPLYEGYNHFEAELADLQPGTAYAYRVGTDDCWSDTAVFTTAAATEPFSFMYLGDSHIGYNENSASVWENLLADAFNDCPDIKFALHSGDIVDEAADIGQWEEFFDSQAGYFDGIPFMPAIGNHENEDSSIYLNSFALPQNGPAGIEEHHYSFDYGNAHFAVMDSNLMGSEGSDAAAGMEWLENDLQNSSKEWKFVMFHHPAYEVTSYDNAQCEILKQYWVPILESNDVDMAFVGHQHMYMRTYPICEGAVQENTSDGITYLMGVSGNKTYLNPEVSDYIAAVAEGTNAISYSIINIDDDILNLITVGADGTILDEFTISKNLEMSLRAGIQSVKLLDDSYEQTNSVSKYYPTCCLQVHVSNYTSQPQTVITQIQLRSGAGANEQYGGEPQGISSMQMGIPATGADIYAEFDLSDIPVGTVYADVYIIDEAGVPINAPYEFSFQVTL